MGYGLAQQSIIWVSLIMACLYHMNVLKVFIANHVHGLRGHLSVAYIKLMTNLDL